MDSLLTRIKRNIKNGTLIKHATFYIKRKVYKWVINHGNIFYFLNKKRVLTKKYSQSIAKINANHIEVGNYFLDKRMPLDKNSIVYSLGILMDVSFDLAMNEKYGCKVHLYDPTPTAIEFMKQHASNPLLKYKPVGVWIENTVMKFFEPAIGGSASMVQPFGEKYFEAPCETMESLMAENKHTEIHVFKADIEGAALPVLEQMMENGVFPDQIVAEFEVPQESMEEANDFFQRLTKIRNTLEKQGFEEFLLPRDLAKYYSMEILFSNVTKVKKREEALKV